MQKLAEAIIKTMADIAGIEKTMKVGEGNYSYQGVSDYEVKKVIGRAMQTNGLSLLPISVTPITKVERWTETNNYQKVVNKQSIFVEVQTKYLLLHESGESIEVAGYGHGVDSQDKAAGKATTYALKYAMLYLFLVPTGKIDDADIVHSNDIAIPTHEPDEGEKQLLRSLVFTSTFDDEKKMLAFASITDCKDYATYSKIQHRLEDNQQSIDEVVNPSAKDINKQLKKLK